MRRLSSSGSDPQMDLFYNTVHISGQELKERKVSNGLQNRQILRFFEENPSVSFTPFEVQRYAGLGSTPITSIRRAINTLTQTGHLIKTDILKPGEYGTMNHTWIKA
jgi:hypothetical protein